MSYESTINELHEQAMAAVFDKKWDSAIKILQNIKSLEDDLNWKNEFARQEAEQEERAFASKYDAPASFIIKRKNAKGIMTRHFPVRDLVKKETDKALGVCTGQGNRNLKFIAKSLCIKDGTEWYAPEWVLHESYWNLKDRYYGNFSEVEM